jgi:hypothetical protein
MPAFSPRPESPPPTPDKLKDRPRPGRRHVADRGGAATDVLVCAIHFATGESPGPTGSAHLLTAPYQAFHASDGWINIGGANQSNWERIAEVLGHPEWRDDARFATNTARLANLPRSSTR